MQIGPTYGLLHALGGSAPSAPARATPPVAGAVRADAASTEAERRDQPGQRAMPAARDDGAGVERGVGRKGARIDIRV